MKVQSSAAGAVPTASGDELRTLPVEDVVARVGVNRAQIYKNVAGLLFTYRCTITCAHCLFGCGTKIQSGPMSVEDGVEFLRQLHELDRVVHIAGGEPFMFWDVLSALVEAAGREGVAPHFIETNSSWAASDGLVRERFRRLRGCGVRGMYFSADPFHFQFVPPDNYLRARAIAAEVFGPENVTGHSATPERAAELVAIGRDEARLADYVRRGTPALVGNAALRLAHYVPDAPLDRLSGGFGASSAKADGPGCRRSFDGRLMWEVHVDPYGNIQTNCGVILGNARKVTVGELLRRDFASENPIASILSTRGPLGLLDLAKARGFPGITHAKQRCHLCFLVRSFLRPHFPGVLGPDEVYHTSAAALSAHGIIR
jgi:hypothetical protein